MNRLPFNETYGREKKAIALVMVIIRGKKEKYIILLPVLMLPPLHNRNASSGLGSDSAARRQRWVATSYATSNKLRYKLCFLLIYTLARSTQTTFIPAFVVGCYVFSPIKPKSWWCTVLCCVVARTS